MNINKEKKKPLLKTFLKVFVKEEKKNIAARKFSSINLHFYERVCAV